VRERRRRRREIKIKKITDCKKKALRESNNSVI